MEFLQLMVDFIIHVDQHLYALFAQYGLWIYGILFLIIFCETGLVVTPFLPGDSLLFATGALIASSQLNVHVMAIVCISAAILGNTVNYTIGRFFGARLFSNPQSKIFRQDYLKKGEAFFARHGGKAIVLTRFAPIVRTFVPFTAGMSAMHYGRFMMFNVIGGILWVVLFLYAGFYFGSLPVVRKNFTLLMLAIIVVSFIPVFWESWRSMRKAKPPAV
jgi:membrane-associated protein